MYHLVSDRLRALEIRSVRALPVAALDAYAALEKEADEVVRLLTLDVFGSVGRWYDSFDQTIDKQVGSLLRAVQSGNIRPLTH